jgi:DNA-binding response OmpR family regulator
VLVVDDDVDTVELVAYALERAGFAPSSARTLSEASALMISVHPEAMIADLSLPDGSGAQLAMLPAAKSLKTKILVSGHSGSVVERHEGAQGFDHQLVKPVDIDELIQILSRTLSK